MKSLFALFFSFHFLCSQTFGLELVKLPFLFVHFAKHCSENNSISFLSFINEHYTDINSQDNDQEHDKLPFKHCSDSYTHHSFAIPFVFNGGVQSVINLPIENKNNFKPHSSQVSSNYYGNIWQPPKSC